jgi:hypothetical protein
VNDAEPKNFTRADAVRHAVLTDLLGMLPVASVDQANRFEANLRLSNGEFDREVFRVKLLLRVTPDISETRVNRFFGIAEIEQILARRYGETVNLIPGFYRHRLHLPKRCVLHGYGSRYGFLNGILCQPIDEIDRFFLLSSARFGGPRAIRLRDSERLLFERFKEPLLAFA